MVHLPSRDCLQTIQTRLVQGHQVASGQSRTDRRFPLGTIAMQQPFFKRLGFDLEAYFGQPFFKGTLNLSVVPDIFALGKPEYVFSNIAWTDLLPPENFFLSPAEVRFREKTYRALIYVPDPATKQAHFNPPSMVDVIALPIPGIAYGDTVDLSFNPQAITVIRAPAKA